MPISIALFFWSLAGAGSRQNAGQAKLVGNEVNREREQGQQHDLRRRIVEAAANEKTVECGHNLGYCHADGEAVGRDDDKILQRLGDGEKARAIRISESLAANATP
jgi:hypothetical protein